MYTYTYTPDTHLCIVYEKKVLCEKDEKLTEFIEPSRGKKKTDKLPKRYTIISTSIAACTLCIYQRSSLCINDYKISRTAMVLGRRNFLRSRNVTKYSTHLMYSCLAALFSE